MFAYDAALQRVAFGVPANAEVEVLFAQSGKFEGYIVGSRAGGGNMFNLAGEWIEFLVTADNRVRLRFNPDANWIGIVV